VTGLAQYVAATGRVPDLVIVSDLGAEPQPPPENYKPSILQMAAQPPELTSRVLHGVLYRDYSAGAYRRDAGAPSLQPFLVERRSIWPQADPGPVPVFILAPTSPAERGRFAEGTEKNRIAQVANISTLHELEPAEIDAAFWAGG